MAHVRQQIRDAFVSLLSGATEGADLVQDPITVSTTVETPFEEISLEDQLAAYGSRVQTRRLSVDVTVAIQTAIGSLLDALDAQAVAIEAALPGTIETICDVYLESSEVVTETIETERTTGVLRLTFVCEYRTLESAPETAL